MSDRRRICVVTGGRAEYGLIYWLLREIKEDPLLELQLVVTGSHLVAEFGLTYKVIEEDGFSIDRKVEMLLASDSPAAIAKGVGLGTIGFSDALASLDPDAVVVLGDRFEILAAAQAAMFFGIALVHIHGGEVTQGSIDDSIRHAITKMARYHFVAADVYRNRVIQLGEQPDRVFNVGGPALDNIARMELLSRDILRVELGFDVLSQYLLVTYHPVTTDLPGSAAGMRGLLGALEKITGYKILFTRPNADAGNRDINRMIDEFSAGREGSVYVATSLGQLRYLSAMRHCAAVIGNSSSGIVEAPAMHKPVVNIGPRQTGRLKATCVIDCGGGANEISDAIRLALSREFATVASQTVSLYGDSSASNQICKALGRLDLTRNVVKCFYDLP